MVRFVASGARPGVQGDCFGTGSSRPNGQGGGSLPSGRRSSLYLIEGTAFHVEQGKPDLPLKAGDSYAIPPRAIHAPRGGPEGARAIVFRVHLAGQPERIDAPE